MKKTSSLYLMGEWPLESNGIWNHSLETVAHAFEALRAQLLETGHSGWLTLRSSPTTTSSAQHVDRAPRVPASCVHIAVAYSQNTHFIKS